MFNFLITFGISCVSKEQGRKLGYMLQEFNLKRENILAQDSFKTNKTDIIITENIK